MTIVATPRHVEQALAQRLRAIWPLLGAGASPDPEVLPLGDVLDELVRVVRRQPNPDRVWLLCVAVAGALPMPGDVRMGVRIFQLASVTDITMWLLDVALKTVRTRECHREMRLVTGGVVVDVSQAAGLDRGGFPRLWRGLVGTWQREREFVPAVWCGSAQALRIRTFSEERLAAGEDEAPVFDEESAWARSVVPWRSVVVAPQTPPSAASERLVAMAQFSGNTVVGVVHDCAPALSADTFMRGDPLRFTRYLNVVKHAGKVACLGATARTELEGFLETLSSQGLAGPELLDVDIPVDTARLRTGTTTPAGTHHTDLVLCSDDLGPRSDHGALFFAAERLWREGRRFTLVLAGSIGIGDSAAEQTVARLNRAGFPVHIQENPDDAALASLYQLARFTVTLPLHDGLCENLVASLEQGIPAVTRAGASARRLALDGGALLVEADDEQLVEAMRRLLIDDDFLGRLRQDIRARTPNPLESCANQLWERVVAPAGPPSGSLVTEQ